jgi:hypothetical protein
MDHEWNDRETSKDMGSTRRQLLRAATGGFALTASGLFLPEGLAETAAREGALGGDKGGRRGNDQKGRHRHRSHGDKKDKKGRKDEGQRPDGPPPQGHGPFRATAVTVEGRWRDIEDIDRWTFTFYYRVKTGLDSYGPWIESHTATPATDALHRYAPDRFRVGVLLTVDTWLGPAPRQAFVDLRNMAFGFPLGSMSAGVGLDPVHGKLGETIVAEKALALPTDWFVDKGFTGRFPLGIGNRDGYVYVRRLDNSADFIEFRLEVSI